METPKTLTLSRTVELQGEKGNYAPVTFKFNIKHPL